MPGVDVAHRIDECEISRSAFTDRLALHATLPSAFEARRHNEIRSIREDVTAGCMRKTV